MARKGARRPGSPRRKAPSSGARKPSKLKRILSRHDRLRKPVPYEQKKAAFAAVAEARRLADAGQPYDLRKLAREHGTTLATIHRFPQLTKRGRSLEVTAGDIYSRRLNIYIPLKFRDGDIRTVTARNYKDSQLISRYATTIDKVKTGKLPPSALDEFKGLTVGREKQPLLADWSRIKRLLDADINITELYSRDTGGVS